jgi:hypothetical protein
MTTQPLSSCLPMAANRSTFRLPVDNERDSRRDRESASQTESQSKANRATGIRAPAASASLINNLCLPPGWSLAMALSRAMFLSVFVVAVLAAAASAQLSPGFYDAAAHRAGRHGAGGQDGAAHGGVHPPPLLPRLLRQRTWASYTIDCCAIDQAPVLMTLAVGCRDATPPSCWTTTCRVETSRGRRTRGPTPTRCAATRSSTASRRRSRSLAGPPSPAPTSSPSPPATPSTWSVSSTSTLRVARFSDPPTTNGIVLTGHFSRSWVTCTERAAWRSELGGAVGSA